MEIPSVIVIIKAIWDRKKEPNATPKENLDEIKKNNV